MSENNGEMVVTLIAAVAANGVIGSNADLPWHLPGDLAHFRKVTLGKPVIMGAATFGQIGEPLDGRFNIVLSRSAHSGIQGAHVADSLSDALAVAGRHHEEGGEVMVIGGAEVYAETLPLATRFYKTEVLAEVQGNVYFPEYNTVHWVEVARSGPHQSDRDSHSYNFVTLERAH